jgi:branched-chain amino acid transport system permease protein
VLVFLATFPYFSSPLILEVAIIIGLTLPGAIALSVLQGMAGLISAGNAAFMAIGGLSVAMVLQLDSGMPFLLNLLIGGVVAAIIGAIIGLTALRVRGLYLLITTLALQFIVVYVFQDYQTHVVGDSGFIFSAPKIGSFIILTMDRWYFLLLIVGAFFIYAMKNWTQSRIGRSWIALRDGVDAAEILGVNVARTTITVFALTSFVIGVQGVLYAYNIQDIQYTQFTFDLAVQYIAIVIIGGQGSVLGVIFGTVFIVSLPVILQHLANAIPASLPFGNYIITHIANIEEVIYGLLIVFFLLVAPGGLVEIWERCLRRFRRWPLSLTANGDVWQ